MLILTDRFINSHDSVFDPVIFDDELYYILIWGLYVISLVRSDDREEVIKGTETIFRICQGCERKKRYHTMQWAVYMLSEQTFHTCGESAHASGVWVSGWRRRGGVPHPWS